ncbi:MAG: triose-phosphate isomerase [Phycisphaerales bacterium]|nr:MAG: triose-phosphate isomerase [Phycisphaerales bacterium]
MPSRKPIVGGNWKMYTTQDAAAGLARDVAAGLIAGTGEGAGVEVVVFPPFPYLLTVGAVLRERGGPVALGGQDVWTQPEGAFTGEVSGEMLRDCGCTHALVGHSERRHVLGESDELVGEKLRAALSAGLHAVLCVGEKLDEREGGRTDAVNERQLRAALAGVGAGDLSRVVIAYEPVWAIGTGKTATPEDAQRAHAAIRAVVASMYDADAAEAIRIQYGGSVKPGNAAELFAQPDIDGGLIGGASLQASDFLAICGAAGGSAR